MRTIGRSGIQPFIVCALSFAVPFAVPSANGQTPVTPSADARPKAASEAPTSSSEIEQLRKMILEQQRQIDDLKRTMADQKSNDSTVAAKPDISVPPTTSRGIGQIASTTPILPPLPAVTTLATPLPVPQAAASAATTAANPCEADPDKTIPTFLRLGSICLVPIGFMDFTPFWRDKNAASSMGSNFGGVPYNNSAAGNLSEFHFSQQNSRLGFRIDGNWKGAHFIGYNEFDFNGTSGSTSLAVSNGAIVPRLRLYWADVRKGKVEFLAGQSWSMLVPNRNGISALPGDLFYSQVVDINYIAGLTWTRQPGLRILYHPSKKVTFGFSVEQPDQYIGGSAGGQLITLPSALSGLASTQLDAAANISGASYLGQPGFTPDFIAKLAFDYPRVHFEVAGIESNFKTTSLTAPWVSHTTQGAGLLVGLNVAVTKNVRLISNNFYSDGEGRYLFGQAPDLIVRADGSLSGVHASSTIEGFEARMNKNNLLLYGYYSAIYIGRNAAFDANGTSRIGYGVAANSQNRVINEGTFGFNQTIWSNARYGGINLMGQYEYLERSPWTISAGNPKQTHDNTIYFNIRYTLPGGMPNF
ncbi:MAG: SlyX family protein [Acidobacteriia bacterium]|nr:SlyX family protein [Terriglobia bacterium]